MSWRGWVKMAFQQPLLPVIPVARELISKTKWITSSSKTVAQFNVKGPPQKLGGARALSVDDDTKLVRAQSMKVARAKSPNRGWQKGSSRKLEPPVPHITSLQIHIFKGRILRQNTHLCRGQLPCLELYGSYSLTRAPKVASFELLHVLDFDASDKVRAQTCTGLSTIVLAGTITSGKVRPLVLIQLIQA
ncbi:hypothetical protein DXG01_001562 [Tephrocybe rancida]|nr:hypothetical protein DXG01_001562 [Tephrocybe rancida]